MNKYYVTVGQRYRQEQHPLFPRAHPDGWITVHAESYNRAREGVEQVLGEHWSVIYSELSFHKDYFPKGEVGAIRFYDTAGSWVATTGLFA